MTENENEKNGKRKHKLKCQNSKTCHSTKVLSYNTGLTCATITQSVKESNICTALACYVMRLIWYKKINLPRQR